MAELTLIEHYSQAVDALFATRFYFEELRQSPNRSFVTDVKGEILHVQSYSTTGMVDDDRETISQATRNYDNEIKTYPLRRARKWKTLVDPINVKSTGDVGTVARVTQTFNNENKLPEHNKYYASTLYKDFLALGGTADNTVPTVDNILATIDKYMEQLDEEDVPAEGRILYVTPTINTMIKSAISRSKDVNNTSTQITSKVTRIDELTIKKVPSKYMKTLYDSTVGMVEGIGAKQINMILAHPGAVLPWEYYSSVKLDAPTASNDDKYVYFEREVYDIHIFAKKYKAFMFNVAS